MSGSLGRGSWRQGGSPWKRRRSWPRTIVCLRSSGANLRLFRMLIGMWAGTLMSVPGLVGILVTRWPQKPYSSSRTICTARGGFVEFQPPGAASAQ